MHEPSGRLRFSALDFKLGLRMLARYPGLSTVGTVAIAVAIALGSVYFEAINKLKNPRLPIADAERVVSIINWNTKGVEPDGKLLNDFASWRKDLTKIGDLGAAITFQRNLETDDHQIEAVYGAEMSAAGFTIMGTKPLHGRTLTAQDELPGEPPVVVIGHQVWAKRFNSDPNVVGKTVKLGTVSATIVGVMPEGFGFPINHRIWMPLRTDGSLLAPRTGPNTAVFGRLAPGATMEEAQAELDVVGARMASANPETHKDLKPRVLMYQKPLFEGGEAGFFGRLLIFVNSLFLALLTVVCTNVGTLVFARTATRSWEITVRNALGASRGRIIAQLFIEALVLTGTATVVGLFVARVAMGYGIAMMTNVAGEMPFWVEPSLSWKTIVYAGFLAVFAAAIVGILPALRVTRGSLHDKMRSQSSGGGLKFGWFWTAVIVAQVAITVIFIPLAAGGIFESNRFEQRAAGIGADRFLTASLALDREEFVTDSASVAARTQQSFETLEQRLLAEPGVQSVAFSDRVPVEDQFKYVFTIDTTTGMPAPMQRTSTLVHVSPGFFAAYGSSVVAGRGFGPLDVTTGRVMIVNQSFAHYVFGDKNPVGQRVRIGEGEVNLHTGDEWYEIVGMVKDFGWQLDRPEERSAMYLPSLPSGRAHQMAVQVRNPEGFANRLRTIAAEVDPRIRLTEVRLLSKAGGGEAQLNWTLTAVAGLVAFIVLLLSSTGIHALMSFIVARRTREIGVRTALGARPGRIIAGIFGRAFIQLGVGLALGSTIVALAGLESARQVLLLIGADALMLTVGLAACAVPLRRALRIDPTEALRAEV